MYLSSSSGSSRSTNALQPLQLDAMEAALDGVSTAEQARVALEAALARADSDPEQIMLSLRGLPVFPNPPRDSDASSTPEAAFIVAGGPTCLLREVIMAPYPHPEAPQQIYLAIDSARRTQNISDFKPALRTLREVLLVWKKKHLWKVLRDDPSMSLADGLAEEVRRAEERRQRAIRKEEERLRKEEEEREFARKLAEHGEDADADDTPHHEEPQPHSPEDSEDDYDDDEEEHEERVRRRRLKAEPAASSTATLHAAEVPPATAAKLEPEDEILEFPTVTPEEELEFLTFFYNQLGTIYQSAGAAASSTGTQLPGGPRLDGVRWGRMKVIPCRADTAEFRTMLEGSVGGSVSSTHVVQPSYAANLATSILEEQEPHETDEDFIATSPHDLSNSSDARALIALWQAKRAHDLYVQLREGERNRALDEQREREAAARGKPANPDDDDDDASAGAGSLDGGASGVAAQSAHTTLGLAGFGPVNVPNLSLAQLQSESKALGLFAFPHAPNLAAVGGPAAGAAAAAAGAGAASTQSGQEQERSLIFWSTQPIVQPAASHPKNTNDGHAAPQSQLQQPAAKLINPYAQCSSADAATYSNLGATLFHLGNYPLALRCFHVSLQIRCATLRAHEDEYVDVATSLNNLGVVLAQLHHFALAWSYFTAAFELARTRLDPVHPRLNLIQSNMQKTRPRRQGVLPAPGLLQELRVMAEAKELKEHIAREKKAAKAAKKGAKPETARKPPPGKKEAPPVPFHEDPRFFRPPVPGQPPVVPVVAEGAPPAPLGTAAAGIQTMPLRQWETEMGAMQALMLEFGPAKKKTSSAAGKKKTAKKK